MADKARFYLEQQVPELKEYEKKKIFSKDEITSIMKKRSDFEHKINSPGPHASDFARYAEYEMNLDTLRKKRVKRLGIKAPTHSGQRRIFFILERATKKLHGDLGLWMQYIEYARKQKAHKKLSQIFLNVLRFHPTKDELWVYAARYALEEHADMMQARSYMQRGLRFCKSSRNMWIQYAKLEMIYISRIAARQKILGLDEDRSKSSVDHSITDPNADMIALPDITEEDINPTLSTEDEVDQTALQNLNATPALTGAIPMAIFDAAMTHFNNDAKLGHEFFDMFLDFGDTPSLPKILEHIVESMMRENGQSHHAQICYIRLPTARLSPTSPQFPRAFGTSLSRLRECMEQQPGNDSLATEILNWLRQLLETDDLDPALHKVMATTIRSIEIKQSSGGG